MKNITDTNHVNYLNRHFSEQSFDQLSDDFAYLMNKSRIKPCGKTEFNRAISGNKFGALLKKYDSTAFYASKSYDR